MCPSPAESPAPRRAPRAGQSLVEYALILALVAAVLIPAINFTRAAFAATYMNQQAALRSSPGGKAAKTATSTPTTGVVADVPTDADDCKDGGWLSATRADGTAFKNQGDCVSYAQNGK